MSRRMAHAEPTAAEEAAIDRRVDAEREQQVRCARCRRWSHDRLCDSCRKRGRR